MWEFFEKTLNGGNGVWIIVFMFVIILILWWLITKGKLGVKTTHVQIGGTSRESFYELMIIRSQTEAAHGFINSLEGKVAKIAGELLYGGYFTRYILERVYDEIIKWITLNHIELSEGYIICKQKEIKDLVYSFPVKDEFKTPEFEHRMDKWVQEMIERLLEIRRVYEKQKRG